MATKNGTNKRKSRFKKGDLVVWLNKKDENQALYIMLNEEGGEYKFFCLGARLLYTNKWAGTGCRWCNVKKFDTGNNRYKVTTSL